MSSKKVSFENALKNNYIRKFDYSKFENKERIASGGFGTVYRANSLNLRKLVALKCLHEDDESFYEKFVKELTNILAVNNHDNIINFYGISQDLSTKTYYLVLQYAKDDDESFYEKFVKELTNILAVNNHDNIINFYGISQDLSTKTYYLVLQYAKDGDLRTYLQDNFNRLDWKIKIKMAKDITSGLYCIHEENIVHRDLHSKNILVHEGSLLITDLGLSQSLNTNSNSFIGGMFAYSDPRYLRNPFEYKRSKASDIYSLGVLFWELSSGRPPFNNFPSLEIPKIVINGEREVPFNGTPEDYIKIYSNAWKDDPDQRPTIKNIFDSLENIKLENIYNDPNDNQKAYFNNQSQASMDEFSKDSVSFSSSFTTPNWGEVTEVSQVSIENIKDHVSDQTLTDLANLEITGFCFNY
ncbi:hypothetical protein Glove_71g183 [Diversispora epigaea]|uniref:Protein kinase domain-containing protein n=1 Tax=Diversispora epigaea TaxID=1348612 RepID=A0A397JIZ6_9GLOM|nr:hypothetical protein Glove_71g183 [Diversispora epigaea]